jgi:hypothetical protein
MGRDAGNADRLCIRLEKLPDNPFRSMWRPGLGRRGCLRQAADDLAVLLLGERAAGLRGEVPF